jgi:ribonuclease HII
VLPEAIRLASARCVEEVVASGVHTDPRHFLVLIDGEGDRPPNMPCTVRRVVDGDSCIWQISAASIVAKAYRDARMLALHARYPQWNFAKHKGYPVPEHLKLLKQLGASPVHRETFGPLEALRPTPAGIEEG